MPDPAPTGHAATAHCPMCEAWREAARVLADELGRQRAMAVQIASRLADASAVLAMLAERKERRKMP
jgi:hypothetical protein